MPSFALIVRRVHLYLSLTCWPWFVLFGITALAFNHGDWFDEPNDLYNLSGPTWTKVQTWTCTIDVPAQGQVPREVAAEMLAVAGIQADAYGAFRSGEKQISAYITEFWRTRRLAYDIDRHQLSLYTRQSFARTTMRLMHARAGYRHDGLLNDIWAMMVDAATIGLLLWVASGLYMWWQQRSLRKIGGLCLLAGLLTFVAFLISL
jgi:hypothetical protein